MLSGNDEKREERGEGVVIIEPGYFPLNMCVMKTAWLARLDSS